MDLQELILARPCLPFLLSMVKQKIASMTLQLKIFEWRKLTGKIPDKILDFASSFHWTFPGWNEIIYTLFITVEIP